MWSKSRNGVVVFVGVVAGNYVAEKWILKANPEDPGFILAANGFGLDDLVRAAVCLTAIGLLNMVVPG